MQKINRWSLGAVAGLIAGVSSADAGVPRQLILEGQPLTNSGGLITPGTGSANTGFTFASVTTNAVGGWAVALRTNDGPHVWGSPAAGVPQGSLFRGATLAGFSDPANSFNNGLGLDNAGRTLFNRTAQHYLHSSSGLTQFAGSNDPVPQPLRTALLDDTGTRVFGSFAYTIGLTYDGRALYRTSARLPTVGSTAPLEDRIALVRGLPDGTPEILLQTSQSIPNLLNASNQPFQLSGPVNPLAHQLVFDPATTGFARTGNNYIAEGFLRRGFDDVVGTDGVSGTSNNDSVMLINGSALFMGGQPVRERTNIGAGVGGVADEFWTVFRHASINSAGSYLFTAQAAVGSLGRELVVKDGQILLRSGSVVPFGTSEITLGNVGNNS